MSRSVWKLLLGIGLASAAQNPIPGSSTYKAPAEFPTSLFSSYYVPPSPTQEPQPVVYDIALKASYPFNLTDPQHIPNTTNDPVYFPPSIATISNASTQAFVQNAVQQVREIISGNGVSGNCSKCIAALNVGKLVAQVAPEALPPVFISLCQSTGFASNSSCQATYAAQALGSIWTQVLAYADVSGQDGQYICNSLSSTFCPTPVVNTLNTTGLFPKPKPANPKIPEASGKRVKVLHISDLHLDPRYFASSEANCSSSFCCRTNIKSNGANGTISLPAPLFGSFKCDSPWDLLAAAMEAIEPLTGINNGKNFAIYTGDSAAHDPANQISRAYTEYCENAVYNLIKSYVKAPVYATLGNHDTSPVAIDSPHTLPGPLGGQFTWNYDHVSSLWQAEGWIDSETAAEARIHYGAYSTVTPFGLKIISLNTDFWYRSNILNFINTTNPDVSGMQSFLIQELQAAEDAGQRVWIIGHVLSGWDGTNPLPNPTNLFYQIVERYSPHVIANVMFGHTHEDQNFIFYSNNGTTRNASTALTPGWVGPSVTPLNNLNSGFRLYEVDTSTFDVLDAWTFYSNVSTYPGLDSSHSGPTYALEYSTRDAYQIGWPAGAPLNATYWHGITEAMEQNRTLVSLYNTHQGKQSVLSPNCTSDACAQAKICYMRSASAPIGRECPQGFGSVQSAFTGKNF
jgi:hypothetical protein